MKNHHKHRRYYDLPRVGRRKPPKRIRKKLEKKRKAFARVCEAVGNVVTDAIKETMGREPFCDKLFGVCSEEVKSS